MWLKYIYENPNWEQLPFDKYIRIFAVYPTESAAGRVTCIMLFEYKKFFSSSPLSLAFFWNAWNDKIS